MFDQVSRWISGDYRYYYGDKDAKHAHKPPAVIKTITTNDVLTPVASQSDTLAGIEPKRIHAEPKETKSKYPQSHNLTSLLYYIMDMRNNQDHQKPLNIVFFATSEFAVPTLKYLIQNGYKIAVVFTQPEKPAGRLRVTMPSPVKKTALENNIPVFEPHTLKDEEAFKKFEHLDPELCIIAAYGKIIPSRYLEVPEYGFLNIHPSLLPKYRGPSPIQTAIIEGIRETGVTIMKVDEEMDHGEIVASIKYPVLSIKGYKEIEEDLARLGAELLIETLPEYISSEIEPQEQNHSEATFTKKLERTDGKINWNKTAEEIYNQIRALNPEPGTWTNWSSRTLNIKFAETSPDQVKEQPGTVVKINTSIAVATKKCYLILKQIQLGGGKEMDVNTFLNGHHDFLGSKLD